MELYQKILFITIISILLPSAFSEIKTTNIVSDARSHILFEEFGFSANGVASVSVNSVSWGSSQKTLNLSSIGFFLSTSDDVVDHIVDHIDDFCAFPSNFSQSIVTFKDLHNSTANHFIHISTSDAYVLFFANCASNSTEITMEVRTEMYNIDSHGRKNYLAVGEKWRPHVHVTFFIIYCGFLGLWVFVCYKQRMTAEKIHMVMAALLLFKAIKTACAAEDQWHVQKTGMPHGWDVAFYLFGLFKAVLFFTVIVLIGTGWSFLKPRFNPLLRTIPSIEREKRILMTIIPLQVIGNIARFIINEAGFVMDDWLTWTQWIELVLDCVDIVCFASVFVPVFWSIRNLTEASKTDGKASVNLKKLKLFNKFYLVLTWYYFFTGIASSGIGSLVGYKYFWTAHAVEESGALLFYIFMFYSFRPVEKNPYLYIADEEEEAAAEVLRNTNLDD